MKIIELIIDEEDIYGGIDAISIVEHPAIEEDFVALNKQKEYKLQATDKDKKLLSGALLIPNKMIYRKERDEEYHIYFSRETVRKASQMYLQKGNQNNATFEHEMPVQGLSLVESWIIDDKENDKSNMYGMDLPLGTWFGTIKVNNDKIWNEFVKTGVVKGFSIEGYFSNKAELSQKEQKADEVVEKLRDLFKKKEELETYNDAKKKQ